MTGHLGERLRMEADEVRAYDVYDRCLRTARRRRIASWMVVIAVIALVVPLVDMEAGRRRGATAADGSSGPELPDRVGEPAYGSIPATAWPHLGAASVLLSGVGGRFGDSVEYEIVGADGTGYRTAGWREALLSPDGRTVAYAAPHSDAAARIMLVDLATGRTTRGPVGTPLAWSPDGTRLALARPEATGDHGAPRWALVLADLAAGTERELGQVDGADAAALAQMSIAFAPDGTRLAYVLDGTVHITDPTGLQLVTFNPPPGMRLAGKGAWTPDSLAFAMVEPGDQSWAPRWYDGSDGRETAGPALAAFSVTGADGLTGDELIGWRPDGSALVLDRDRHQVLTLTPNVAQPVAAMALPGTVVTLDLSGAAMASGRVRKADTPWLIGPQLVFCLVLIIGFAIAGGCLLRRARRRERLRTLRPATTYGRIP